MNATHTAELSTLTPAASIAASPTPNAYTPLTEWSILAAMALFLVRGLWAEHCKEETAERELTKKLIDNLMKNTPQGGADN